MKKNRRRIKLAIVSLVSICILLTLPSIPAIEFNTAVETNKSRIIEQLKGMGIEELRQKIKDLDIDELKEKLSSSSASSYRGVFPGWVLQYILDTLDWIFHTDISTKIEFYCLFFIDRIMIVILFVLEIIGLYDPPPGPY